MSDQTDFAVVYFNAAVYYHLDKFQSCASSFENVKYPAKKFANFETFIESGGNITSGSKRTKAFSADAVAQKILQEILTKIAEDVKDIDESETTVTDLAVFKQNRPGFIGLLSAFESKELAKDFDKEVSTNIGKKLSSLMKKKFKPSGKKKISISDSLQGKIINAFKVWTFKAARSVAAGLVFSTSNSISKFTAVEVKTGYLLAAVDAGASLDDFYTATSVCEVWSTDPKEIKKAIKNTDSEDKPKKKNSKTVAQISDDEDEDETPKRRKNAKDDSDDEKPAKSKKNKKPQSDDEDESPKKPAKKPAKIEADEEDEEEVEEDEE